MNLSDELAQKTLAFWNISKVFHTGEGPSMTSSQAITKCNDHFEVLGPQRILKWRFYTLQDRLIRGRAKKRKTSAHPNNVRSLFA